MQHKDWKCHLVFKARNNRNSRTGHGHENIAFVDDDTNIFYLNKRENKYKTTKNGLAITVNVETKREMLLNILLIRFFLMI